jgi:archaellum component FlaC
MSQMDKSIISETINNFIVEFDNSKKQVEKLTEQVNAQKATIEEYKTENEKFKTENEKIKTENEKIKGKIKEVTSENEKIKGKIKEVTSEIKEVTNEYNLLDDTQFEKFKKQIVENRKIDKEFVIWYKSKNDETRVIISKYFTKFIMNQPKMSHLAKKIRYNNYTIFQNNKIRLYDDKFTSIHDYNFENPIFDVPPEFLKYLLPLKQCKPYNNAKSFSLCLIFIEIVNGYIFINLIIRKSECIDSKFF